MGMVGMVVVRRKHTCVRLMMVVIVLLACRCHCGGRVVRVMRMARRRGGHGGRMMMGRRHRGRLIMVGGYGGTGTGRLVRVPGFGVL